jgi:hypothetical protein
VGDKGEFSSRFLESATQPRGATKFCTSPLQVILLKMRQI